MDTNTVKRLGRIRTLATELNAKSDITSDDELRRCKSIALELVELLKAEETYRQLSGHVADARATRLDLHEGTRKLRETRERSLLNRLMSFSEREHRNPK